MTSVLSMETTADPGNSFSQQCSSCDGSSARCWCLDCNEALCDICVSAHRRVTLTRSHRILNQPPAGRVSTPPTKFCRLHPSEPLKLFCFTCNQLTCRDCQLMAHMNHRYQFVIEALDSLKKQLEVWVQPIRAHRDTVRQSLLDMETRLQDLAESESRLKTELQDSYSVIAQHLKNRMDDILKLVQKVSDSECEMIQRRMMSLKQLQQNQQSVTETAEKAQNTNDLSALITYSAQIKSQLKDLPDLVSSLPQSMSQLKVVTDRKSLEAILSLGQLEVSWIPFSVSQTSNQNRNTPAASSSSPLTPTCPAPSCRPLPQTRTTSDTDSPVPPVPVNCPSTSSQSSSSQLCPSPSSSSRSYTTSTSFTSSNFSFPATPPTSTCLAPSYKTLTQTGNTDTASPVLYNLPATYSRSSSNQLCPPTSSSSSMSCCTTSSSDTTLSTSTWPSSFCRSLPQTGTTNNGGSGALLNCHSTSWNSFTASSSSATPPTSTCSAPSCKPMPQARTTNGTNSPVPDNRLASLWKPSSNHSSPPPSSCSSVNQSTAPVTTTTTVTSPQTVECPSSSTVETLSHLSMKPRQVLPKNHVQPVSTSVNLQPVSVVFPPPAVRPSPSCTVFKLQPSLVFKQMTPPHQYQSAPVLLTNTQTVYQVSCLPSSLPSVVPQVSMVLSQTASYTFPTLIWPKQQTNCGSHQMLPVAATGNPIPVGPSHTLPPSHQQKSNHQPLKDKSSTAATSGPKSPPLPLIPDISPHSPSLKHPQQSPVVRAVADSACDRSVQQVAARRQEPAENEPTSTVSEETEPAGKPAVPEVSDRDAEELSSVIGHPDCSLSQWQPRVSLFRLPVSPPLPGRPLPGFRLVPGDAKDEIYLAEMSQEDTQSHVDDVTDDVTVSPPESPVTLQIVTCSACESDNASIICSACGRGYHRDCHVPPVGPDIWSEWICSLCQDLSDTSDPCSSDRPQRAQSPCLSLLDQRRCESLLLYLKVEGCSRQSELGGFWSGLKLLSERLTLRRSPEYRTAAELLSDIWSLFKDASQGDEVLNKLQESFRSRLMETFSSELHPSALMSPSRRDTDGGRRPHELSSTKVAAGEEVMEDLKGSKVTGEVQEAISSVSKLKKTRKRLREFLDLVGTSGSKRTKSDKMED